MSAIEKQQYLAQRSLLLPNPSANWGQQVQLQRHTIQLTEQQRQQLQSMDPQQRSIFIQKLQRDREAQLRAQQQQKLMAQRQQMMAQQQSQQQQMQGQFVTPTGLYFVL